nr:hypothetical protein Iba_chr10bCG10010 [Ipomoea batatas]
MSSAVVRSPVLLSSEIQRHRLPRTELGITQIEPISLSIYRVHQVWGEGNDKDDRTFAFDDLPSAVVIAGASITGCGNMVQKEMDTKRNGRINSRGVLVLFAVYFKELSFNFHESCFAGKNKGSLLLAWRHRRRPEPDGDGLRPRDLPGDNPLTTSSFRAKKNPCFLSILSRTP